MTLLPKLDGLFGGTEMTKITQLSYMVAFNGKGVVLSHMS